MYYGMHIFLFYVGLHMEINILQNLVDPTFHFWKWLMYVNSVLKLNKI